VDALAAGCELQVAAEERHRAGRPRNLAAARAACACGKSASSSRTAWPRRLNGRAGDHLDLAGAVDADPHAAGAGRAADRVVHHPIRWSSHRFDSTGRRARPTGCSSTAFASRGDRLKSARRLVFNRSLEKEGKLGFGRWFLGAWGVGTYRKNDQVDVAWRSTGVRASLTRWTSARLTRPGLSVRSARIARVAGERLSV
jgi:hypothetical protein